MRRAARKLNTRCIHFTFITRVRTGLVADFRNLADVEVGEDAEVVAPVDVASVGVDVDDETRLERRRRARLGVVVPAAERVAGDRRPRRPVLAVPHPLPGHRAVHARRPEPLVHCTHTPPLVCSLGDSSMRTLTMHTYLSN